MSDSDNLRKFSLSKDTFYVEIDDCSDDPFVLLVDRVWGVTYDVQCKRPFSCIF